MRRTTVDMNDYIKMFLFVLNVIHEENKLIVALND